MRKTRTVLAASVAALALLAAACGDDGGKSASPTTTAKAASTGTSGTGASGTGASGTGATGAASSCKLDKAPKIIGLAEKPPEGPNAIPDFANGWDLALEGLTICGQKVEWERLPASPTDNAAAKTNLLAALDKKPDALVGIPNSATVIALAADIKAGATPFILNSGGATAFVGVPNSIGNEWMFIIRPRTAGLAIAQTDYLVKTLGKKKIGLICATQAFGTQSCDAVKPAIEAAGGQVVVRQDADVTATNFTTQILALKNAGVDGVALFMFPNNQVVIYNQAAENGLNVPIFGGASTALAIATKNVTAAGLKNAWGIDDCVPSVDPRAADFAAKYKAKYNAAPGYAAAEAYDQIMILKAAIEKVGKLDKKAIADTLRTMEYKGACEDYKTDAGQGMHHSSYIESFDAAGLPKIEQKISIPG